MVRPAVGGTGPAVGFAAATIYSFNSSSSCAFYSWNFGDGEQPTASSYATQHVFNSPGRFAVTLTGTDAAGTASSTQEIAVKGIAGTWRGTIGSTPPTAFTLVFEQSGTNVTGTYSDDHDASGRFSHVLLGDGRNADDASNWQAAWFSMNITVNAGGRTREFYLNAQASADLDTFLGYCIYYDVNVQVGMRMTRQ